MGPDVMILVCFLTVKWSEVAQLCLTLRDPMDCSLPGFSVHAILQARILEWVAIPSSRGSSQPRNQTKSCIAGRFFTSWATRKSSLVAQMVKSPPAMWETCVWSLDQEDPLEKGMASHSIILAWKILWTEEPGGLQSMGSQRVGPDWTTNTLTTREAQQCI